MVIVPLSDENIQTNCSYFYDRFCKFYFQNLSYIKNSESWKQNYHDFGKFSAKSTKNIIENIFKTEAWVKNIVGTLDYEF